VAAGCGQAAPSDAVVFGSDALRAEVATALEPHRHVRDFVRKERYAVRPRLECVLGTGSNRDSRLSAMADAYWRYGYTLREIATHLGCHQSTVWRQIRRVDAESKSKISPDDTGEPCARIKI
jgi:DNA invertase Pin-like site-specific DNA recombinase